MYLASFTNFKNLISCFICGSDNFSVDTRELQIDAHFGPLVAFIDPREINDFIEEHHSYESDDARVSNGVAQVAPEI